MEHPGRIPRRRRKGDGIRHIGVVVIDIAQHRTAVPVAQDVQVAAELLDVSALFHNKAVYLLSDSISHSLSPFIE